MNLFKDIRRVGILMVASCLLWSCSDIHRGDWVPTDATGVHDAETVGPGDIVTDQHEDLFVPETIVPDVADVHGDVTVDVTSRDLAQPDSIGDIAGDTADDVELPATDVLHQDVLADAADTAGVDAATDVAADASDVLDASDVADADDAGAELPPRDVEDAGADTYDPLACVSSDDECIGKFELDQCQAPHCNTVLGICEVVDKDDDQPCSDGDFCTGPDKCLSGGCVSGPQVSCFDDNVCTLDDCVPASGCANTKLTGGGCDDGDLCTSGDGCLDGDCVGIDYSCDDGKDCTTNVCDGAGGCQYPILAAACLIDETCQESGDPSPGDPCRQCIPGTNQQDWSDVEAGTVVPGAPVWYLDFDGDEYGDPDLTQQVCGKPAGYVSNLDDCDDGNSDINPGITDLCDDVDTDCDGVTDGDYVSTTTYCGTGECRTSGVMECADGVETDSCLPFDPLAEEDCDDGLDNDCDGLTDYADLAQCCLPDCAGVECGPDPVCGIQDCGPCDGSDVCLSGQCGWQVDEYTVNCGVDGMCFVPQGPFWMGCNATVDSQCEPDESPYHQVTLSAYYVDKTEVTADAYQDCFDAGSCTAAGTYSSKCTWGVSVWGGHPANCVNWNQATAYCAWVGKRMPTEAEWEKAGRGVDGRKYPWGNDLATCDRAIMDDATYVAGCNTGGSWDVCSKSPAGDSPYGLCDMAGNMFEWVADRYDSDYYTGSPASDPAGPISGTNRVCHGGSWGNDDANLRASNRHNYSPFAVGDGVGFRCARSEVSAEVCDGIDNDIDGLADEELTYVDWDDGVRALGESCGTGACADGHVVCGVITLFTECSTDSLASQEVANPEFRRDLSAILP